MLYKKLKVRKVEGGWRIKYCDDPFNDVYLTDFELGSRRLVDALKLKWFTYEDMIKATNHKGSNLQGKYDRQHRATYGHKKGCTQACFHVLCESNDLDTRLQMIFGVKFKGRALFE